VYSRVPRQFIRPAEAFGTAGELASVRLFSRMRSNVACLVFEPVEGSFAQRTFVRPRQILLVVHAGLRHINHRGHEADGRGHGGRWRRWVESRCRWWTRGIVTVGG
jgi:hypothetical protein